MCCIVNSELYAVFFACTAGHISPLRGCSALTCPHRAHKKANARVIVTELFSLSDYVKKEKWQFVIKCETYWGAWFPCMYQRVKVYPGLGQSSKFIQCSTSLASQLSSQQYMQRTQHRAHCSLYNTWLGMSMKHSIIPVVHSTIPFHHSIPPNLDTPCLLVLLQETNIRTLYGCNAEFTCLIWTDQSDLNLLIPAYSTESVQTYFSLSFSPHPQEIGKVRLARETS